MVLLFRRSEMIDRGVRLNVTGRGGPQGPDLDLVEGARRDPTRQGVLVPAVLSPTQQARR